MNTRSKVAIAATALLMSPLLAQAKSTAGADVLFLTTEAVLRAIPDGAEDGGVTDAILERNEFQKSNVADFDSLVRSWKGRGWDVPRNEVQSAIDDAVGFCKEMKAKDKAINDLTNKYNASLKKSFLSNVSLSNAYSKYSKTPIPRYVGYQNYVCDQSSFAGPKLLNPLIRKYKGK